MAYRYDSSSMYHYVSHHAASLYIYTLIIVIFIFHNLSADDRGHCKFYARAIDQNVWYVNNIEWNEYPPVIHRWTFMMLINAQ